MEINRLKYTILAFSLLFLGTATTHVVAAPADAVTGAAADIAAREKEAMDGFRALLTAPVKQVPKWPEFVDKFAPKLAGTRYAALGKSLLDVRNVRGTPGRVTIARELQQYLDILPNDISNKIRTMSVDELTVRVKC